MDAMAICQRFGRPHLYVTMTCNPKWPEIRARLKKGQSHEDRPDIVARVFHMKLKELLKDFREGAFGKMVAHAGSVEFQKSGNPHAHMLFWFEDRDAWLEPETIDNFISAEIPDEYIPVKDEDGNPIPGQLMKNPIHRRVTESMLHGPCGSTEYGERSCCANGRCRFNFPKQYQSETEIAEDGYANHRRRSPEEGGNKFTKIIAGGIKHNYTNADVVPYSPWLLKKFDCHINVEYCHSVQCIKYVIKYIKKGTDMATVSVKNDDAAMEDEEEKPRNEPEEFKSKRYVGSVEASWRILEFKMTFRSPSVEGLPVHLPDQQCICYNPSSEPTQSDREELIARNETTRLTDYFRLCADPEAEGHDIARELFYREIPEHFRWNKDVKPNRWTLRKHTRKIPETIGRVHLAYMSDRERFALRILLNHTKGARGYAHLKTVYLLEDGEDGRECGTFMEACMAKNLVLDDQYYIDCMEEHAEYTTNIRQLRELFVNMITVCEVFDPMRLYNTFKDAMRVDFMHRYKQFFEQKEIPQLSRGEFISY